jgi:hypothetical protein
MPAALSGAMNLAGLPAEVVTKRMPDSQTKRSMASSFRKRIGRFTPKGRPSGHHLADLGLAVGGLARRGFDDAQAARARHGRGQRRAGDPAHGACTMG